eukprot:scaffold10562_cov63-Phaeocystis_antarctica.AAC.2
MASRPACPSSPVERHQASPSGGRATRDWHATRDWVSGRRGQHKHRGGCCRHWSCPCPRQRAHVAIAWHRDRPSGQRGRKWKAPAVDLLPHRRCGVRGTPARRLRVGRGVARTRRNGCVPRGCAAAVAAAGRQQGSRPVALASLGRLAALEPSRCETAAPEGTQAEAPWRSAAAPCQARRKRRPPAVHRSPLATTSAGEQTPGCLHRSAEPGCTGPLSGGDQRAHAECPRSQASAVLLAVRRARWPFATQEGRRDHLPPRPGWRRPRSYATPRPARQWARALGWPRRVDSAPCAERPTRPPSACRPSLRSSWAPPRHLTCRPPGPRT